MKLISAVVLLLLGITTNGTKLKERMRASDSLSLEAGVTHTCQHSINRLNAGPANFTSIIGKGVKYTDPTFTPDRDSI